MTKEEWKEIKWFSPQEAFGDPDKMSFDLLKRLDALREFCGNPIIIHYAYATGGHSENSQHYLGNAADLHIEGTTLINQYLLSERFNFGGLGIYPEWNDPGLHCDVRRKGKEEPYNRWAKVNGKYVFLNETVLRRLITAHLFEKFNIMASRLVECFNFISTELNILQAETRELKIYPKIVNARTKRKR